MSGRRGAYGGLDEEARAALLGRVRQSQSGPDRPAGTLAGRRNPPLTELPAYQMIAAQRAAADLLGIASPFFRAHAARAGARTVVDGREVLNFASYDYLGFNADPAVAAAAKRAIDAWGTSVSASRVVAGERSFHRELENGLARLHGVEDAVVMVSGHATNVAVIPLLVGPGDLVAHDALIHNSCVVGAQLSGAARRTFPHNDLDALEALLMRERPRHARILIVVEGHYSMDGDCPDLARLVALKERFGAWLMVDEAHSVGVLGANGRGLAEMAGVEPRAVDIWMGTLSKTLAASGGYVAGSAALVDLMKAAAPGFVYSVGLAPPNAAAALAALEGLERGQERIAQLAANARLFLEEARRRGLDTGTSEGHAIVPVIVGDSVKAVALSNYLLKHDVNVLPIIHPAVPERSARLRFFLNATHRPEDIRTAVAATAEAIGAVQGAGEEIATALAAARRHG